MPVKEFVFGDGIKWIDITNPSREEVETINSDYGFNLHLLHDCLDPDHLPKYDVINNVEFFIVRYYSHSIDKRVSSIQELTNKVAVFSTEKLIITIHRSEIHFLSDIKLKYIDQGQMANPKEFVIKIIWYALHTFTDPTERLSEQVEFYENHIVLRNIEPGHLEALYFIKRQAAVCHKVMTLTLEPINHIKIDEELEVAMDDVRDLHLRLMTLFNQVLDDVNNLMNLYMSFSAQKTNDVVKILTIFSVFFMPLTFIAGIYGMNFVHMPELKERWGYPLVLVLMVIVVAIIYIWFKRKKWL